MRQDILIAGVGGQGTVLASRLIAAAAMAQGAFVRTAETIGMAQRGGSVVSHVRIAAEELSPLIPLAKADLIIAFEPAEAVRSLERLAPGGRCIVNTKPIYPISVTLQGASYPLAEIQSHIQKQAPDSFFLDASALAQKAGGEKALNIVLLGAAIGFGLLPISLEQMADTIAQTVPTRFQEMNQRALQAGFAAAQGGINHA